MQSIQSLQQRQQGMVSRTCGPHHESSPVSVRLGAADSVLAVSNRCCTKLLKLSVTCNKHFGGCSPWY